MKALVERNIININFMSPMKLTTTPDDGCKEPSAAGQTLKHQSFSVLLFRAATAESETETRR